MDYPSSETCGAKGSAVCGTLPSTPPVELVGGMSSLSWEWFDHLSRAFFPMNVRVQDAWFFGFALARLLLLRWKDSCSLPSPFGGVIFEL